MTISGGDVGGSDGFNSYIKSVITIGLESGFTREDAEYIAYHYGSNSEILFRLGKVGKEEANRYQLPLRIYAQLIYAMKYESAVSPCDFLIRRSGMLYFYPVQLKQVKEGVIQLMRDKVKWTSQMEELFLQDLQKQMEIMNL